MQNDIKKWVTKSIFQCLQKEYQYFVIFEWARGVTVYKSCSFSLLALPAYLIFREIPHFPSCIPLSIEQKFEQHTICIYLDPTSYILINIIILTAGILAMGNGLECILVYKVLRAQESIF